jgi:PAS domain S-box-containing protein
MEHAAATAVAGPVPDGIGLDDIVDVEAIRKIAENFHALTGHVVSIVDLDDRFLVRVGRTEPCARFHRANAESCELCRQSDLDLTGDVPRSQTRAYRCKNGMWHVVSPLFVGDRHMGNIFTSQFFYDDEEIDFASFEARAARFGYDREGYLAAIRAIPRYSHETIDTLMRFYAGLAEQIAALGLSRLHLAETMVAGEQALEARIDSEMRYSALVEGAPIPIAVNDPEGRIDLVNKEFGRLFGYTRDDVPTVQDWYERAYPDEAYRTESVARWNAELEAAAHEGRSVIPHEYSVTCKNGEARTVVISGAAVGDHLLVLMEDVTERRRVEDALRSSEAKFAAAYRTSPDAVNINRLSDGLYLEVNKGFTSMTGYTVEDVRGRTSEKIRTWVDPADGDRLMRGLRADGVVANLEAELRRKDGSTVTSLVSARIMDVAGEPCILSVTRDISERKHAEFLLRESQRIARVGHYEWDMVLDHWGASEVLMDIFGIDETYVTDLAGFLNIVHADDRAAVRRYVTEHVVGRGLPFDREYRIVRVSDGAERWVHGLGTITFNESGTPLSLFGVIQDTTERKRSEAEVEKSAAQLERMVYDVAETMGRIVEARDPYTQGHQQRVATLGKRIAHQMGLSESAADEVEMAGLLHDVGKLRVPTEILTKPGHLSSIEFALVKDHPAQSHEILKAIAFPWAVAEIALQHHERMDGSGYPNGLKGEEILLAARILAVADVVEAMASHRPYRPALGEDAAIEEIVSHPEHYDADVIAACVALHANGGLGL